MTAYIGARTEFPLPLQPLGSDGAGFRFENKNGEKQLILQDDTSGLSCCAHLVRVYHGKYKNQKGDATILFIDFLFDGIRSDERRFRQAEIEIRFERCSPPKGQQPIDAEDPIVDRIAPEGYFVSNQSTLKQSKTLAADVHVGLGAAAGMLPVNSGTAIGIDLGFRRTQWIEKQAQASIEGQMLSSENRTSGAPNVARWTLIENTYKKDGIPRKLQTVILLRPETAGAFEARVKVETTVDWAHPIKRLFGQRMVDPVLFAPKEMRKHLGDSLPPGLDLKNMIDFDLTPFGMATSSG